MNRTKLARSIGAGLAIVAAVGLFSAAVVPFDIAHPQFIELPTGERIADEPTYTTHDAAEIFAMLDADGATGIDAGFLAAMQGYFLLAAIGCLALGWLPGTWRGQFWLAIGVTYFLLLAALKPDFAGNEDSAKLAAFIGMVAALWIGTAGGLLIVLEVRKKLAAGALALVALGVGIGAGPEYAVAPGLLLVLAFEPAQSRRWVQVTRRSMVALVLLLGWLVMAGNLAGFLGQLSRWLHLKFALGTLGAHFLMLVGGWDALMAWATNRPGDAASMATDKADSRGSANEVPHEATP